MPYHIKLDYIEIQLLRRASLLLEDLRNKISVSIRHPVYVFFLDEREYLQIKKDYGIPNKSFFVESKAILFINRLHFKELSKNDILWDMLIKHELMHILLGKLHLYLPFWLEEGICQYYSSNRIVSNYQKNEKNRLISLFDYNRGSVSHIYDLNYSEEEIQNIYNQSVSFVSFLIQHIGEVLLWQLLPHVGIINNFYKVYHEVLGEDFNEVKELWLKNI